MKCQIRFSFHEQCLINSASGQYFKFLAKRMIMKHVSQYTYTLSCGFVYCVSSKIYMSAAIFVAPSDILIHLGKH